MYSAEEKARVRALVLEGELLSQEDDLIWYELCMEMSQEEAEKFVSELFYVN